MLRLSVVISIKVGGKRYTTTTRVDNIRNLARRHFAAHGHHFFVGRALLVPVLITSRLPQPRVRHILLHFHALRRLCAHASYQHSKESRFRLVWWKVGLVAPRYAGTETVTAQQPHTSSPAPRPGSGRLPLVRRDGSPHSVKACVRLQCLCLLADVYLGRCLCFSTTCARMIQDTSRLNLTSTLQVQLRQ